MQGSVRVLLPSVSGREVAAQQSERCGGGQTCFRLLLVMFGEKECNCDTRRPLCGEDQISIIINNV